MALGVAVDAPRYRRPVRAGAGRDVLAEECPARAEDPLVGVGEVADQDIEMHRATAGREPRGGPAVPWNESRWPCGGGSRVTHPGYHCTGIPPTSPAQNLASCHGSALSSTISRIQPIGPAGPAGAPPAREG